MKIRGIFQTAVGLVLATLIVIAAGCIVDPKEAIDENPVPVVEWPDRTDKEDCIEIIQRVYDDKDIEKYKEVLLKPDDDRESFKGGYIWNNQELQTDSLGDSYDYDTDCEGTLWILDNAEVLQMNLFPSVISGTKWNKEDMVLSEPCADCWSISKNYRFSISFGDGSFQGNDEVRFTVGPDPDNPGKYVVYRADDILTQ